MHYLMLITLTMPPDATSSDARHDVYDRLLQDGSFCGDGGRFGTPRCDWFVIGGRWSGYLQLVTLGNAYDAAVEAECADLAGEYYTRDAAKRNQEVLNRIWQRVGGTGISPHLRDSYQHFGYDDDAVPVTRAIYDKLLAAHAGESQDGDCQFVDLDDDPVDESFIDHKWIVVVDYHS